MKLLIPFFLFFLFALSCKEERTIVVRFDSVPDLSNAAKECNTASDCIAVPVECCDCAHGGKLKAAPKSKAAASACADVLCVQMMSSDKTCKLKAACENGHCVLRE